ncbi:hypothetical protein Tco_0789339 [Tanacetum coccineum]
MVIEMDDKVPIILGWPMLATPHARMDVIGNLLELNDLLGENEMDPFGVLSDSDGEIGIGLDDLLEELGNLLGNPALEMANNEDVSNFIERRLTEVLLGRPFKDSTEYKENTMDGLVWFANGNDKTIF